MTTEQLVERRLATVETHVDNMRSDLREIKDGQARLEMRMNGRPSWPVTFYLTALTAACGVLATALVSAS